MALFQYNGPTVMPNWGQSIGQGLTSGIDSIVEGIKSRQKADLQRKQLDIAKHREDLSFMQETGYNPSDLIAGSRVSAPGVSDTGIPSGSGVMSPNQHDQYDAWQKFSGDIQAQRGAKTSLLQSQARLAGARADALHPGGASGVNPVDTMAQQALRGELNVDKLPGFGANSLKGQVYQRMYELQPDFNKQSQTQTFLGQDAQTRFQHSAGVQSPLNIIESTLPHLDTLLSTSDQVPRTGSPLINKGLQFYRTEIKGDPAATNFDVAAKLTADQVGKFFASGGSTGNAMSDAKMKQAGSILSTSQSGPQLKQAAQTIYKLMKESADALRRGAGANPGQVRMPGTGGATPTGNAAHLNPEQRWNEIKQQNPYASDDEIDQAMIQEGF